MKSRKDFLFGLGLGLVFVSIIWIISLRNVVGDDQTIKKAYELGMIFPKDLGRPDVVSADEFDPNDLEEETGVLAPPSMPVVDRYQNFTVKSGSSARTIANELEAMGIISDANKLVDELTKMQLTAKIKAKSYRFNITHGPLDIYTVIKELTK